MALALEPNDDLFGDGSFTFADLHRVFFDDVRRFIQRRIGDAHLAEDLAQETFLRAYRARDSYDPMRPVWPWLATIAKNLAINNHRNAERRSRSYRRAEWEEAQDHPEVRIDADPEASLAERDRREAIARTLAQLSPRQRRILSLRCINDLSYEEIAAQEKLTVDALKSVLKRARQSFRANYLRIVDETEVPFVFWGPGLRGRLARLRIRLSSVDVRPFATTAQSVGEVLAVAGVSGVMLFSSIATPGAEHDEPLPKTAPAVALSTDAAASPATEAGTTDPSEPGIGDRSSRMPVDASITQRHDRATAEADQDLGEPSGVDTRSSTEIEIPCTVATICDAAAVTQGIGR